jgi:hydroxymethylglutaryl-CoA lyase
MAADELTGNMPSEKMIAYFNEQLDKEVVDMTNLNKAIQEAGRVF